MSYAITSGNTGSVFDIDDETGDITVAAALDHETTDEYTLTVEAEDSTGGTDTVTVTVMVTDVVEDPPPAPTGVDASLTGGVFSLSWTALAGAAKYEPQYTTDDVDAATVTWTALPEVTTTTASYTPSGGPACGTEYRFRVRAFGDGSSYTAMWGTESATDTVTTPTCPPAFDPDVYTFEVAEDAAVLHIVGTVSATDQDQDTLYYSITAGNGERKFGISPGRGTLRVVAALDYETTDEYTLTVTADDRKGGTDTATVTITVTNVAEDPPPAPSGLAVTLADGTFTVSWNTLEGASKYEVQHRTDATDSQWTALPETGDDSVTYAPEGGPDCSTEYRFRVRAFGDGDTYVETWGDRVRCGAGGYGHV